jgi:glutathione S-transferase
MKVYGSRVSYYTGKLEAYLRYKQIDYSLHGMPYHDAKRLREKVGSIQMPIVEREDGRWMSDSTPILLHLEEEHPGSPILPANPVVGFVARLIEDYADEWLWRPAMHYRWSYPYDRELLSNILVDEVAAFGRMPRFVKRRLIRYRQTHFFVKRDGVRQQTWDHVEQGYFNALGNMSAMLENRPFMLGDAPSLADFGLMGPMLRHFGQDPTPEEIMRTRAPRVYAWVARMWNAQGREGAQFLSEVPGDAQPMLKEICQTHLEQLSANATAYGAGEKQFEMTVQGCDYTQMPVSRYRVHCLEKLRERFAALGPADQDAVRALLPYSQAEILWSNNPPAASAYDPDEQLPFGRAINVYGTGTP